MKPGWVAGPTPLPKTVTHPAPGSVSGIELAAEYDDPGSVRMGGNNRRVRRNVWFGSCAALVVVGLARPCTAI